MNKMFQINSVYKRGSTGRIVEELGKVAISQGWESYIAFGRTYSFESDSVLIKIGNSFDLLLHVLLTRLFDRHGFGSKRATMKLIKRIRQINPDVIVLHNLHGYYINISVLFNFLKTFGKPVFWTLYDCWAFTGHCCYFDLVNCDRWKTQCHHCPAKHSYPASWVLDNSKNNYRTKSEIFKGVDNLHLIVNSKWLKDNVAQSFLKDYPIHLISNGIDLSNFKPTPHLDLRERYQLGNKFIILGIAGVWSERKGLKDFCRISELLSEDEIIVLDGLNKKQRKGLPANVVPLERAENTLELSKLYSMADVFFNPTYEDNFPTTNLESLACGTPVITYKTGGSPEAVDEKTGFVVEKGDIIEAYSAIQRIRETDDRSEACIHRAKAHFDYKERFVDYMDLFENQLSIKNYQYESSNSSRRFRDSIK